MGAGAGRIHRHDDRLLELAARLRDELPPIEPGTQAATALGMSGRLNVEIADRGPGRIELRTTEGRIRGEGVADMAPAPDGRTNVTVSVEIQRIPTPAAVPGCTDRASGNAVNNVKRCVIGCEG